MIRCHAQLYLRKVVELFENRPEFLRETQITKVVVVDEVIEITTRASSIMESKFNYQTIPGVQQLKGIPSCFIFPMSRAFGSYFSGAFSAVVDVIKFALKI